MAAISMASLLKRQSPSVSYGHGWIMGKDGKRWHPVLSKSEPVIHERVNKRGKLWLLKMIPH